MYTGKFWLNRLDYAQYIELHKHFMTSYCTHTCLKWCQIFELNYFRSNWPSAAAIMVLKRPIEPSQATSFGLYLPKCLDTWSLLCKSYFSLFESIFFYLVSVLISRFSPRSFSNMCCIHWRGCEPFFWALGLKFLSFRFFTFRTISDVATLHFLFLTFAWFRFRHSNTEL